MFYLTYIIPHTTNRTLTMSLHSLFTLLIISYKLYEILTWIFLYTMTLLECSNSLLISSIPSSHLQLLFGYTSNTQFLFWLFKKKNKAKIFSRLKGYNLHHREARKGWERALSRAGGRCQHLGETRVRSQLEGRHSL